MDGTSICAVVASVASTTGSARADGFAGAGGAEPNRVAPDLWRLFWNQIWTFLGVTLSCLARASRKLEDGCGTNETTRNSTRQVARQGVI